MTEDIGIIDKKQNPFYDAGWCGQNLPLTPHRKDQLRKLLGYSVESIKRLTDNEGKYVAFVAIRWGFAELIGGKLTETEKLLSEGIYDGRGKLIDKYENKSPTQRDELIHPQSLPQIKQDNIKKINSMDDNYNDLELNDEIVFDKILFSGKELK